jgi:hypothetical protein
VADRWEDAGVVRGFSTAAPNEILLDFVRRELTPLRDASVDLVVAHEYNRPVPGRTLTRVGPVIYEGTFRAVSRS